MSGDNAENTLGPPEPPESPEPTQSKAPVATQAPRKTPAKPRSLPPYKVLLHNDDVNDMHHVTVSIVMLTPLAWEQARERTHEAHYKGVTLLLVTHKERAELYQQQFMSRRLTVTIEPDAE